MANATDAEGDTLSYSKLTGPAWLAVAADGSLSGTPAQSDAGANVFTVEVDDGNGGTDTATLNITVDGPAFTLSSSTAAGATHDNLPTAFVDLMASGNITPTTTSDLGGTYAISNISDGERDHSAGDSWASATAASCSVTLTFASTDISGLAFNWAWGDRTPGDYEIVINGVTSLGTFTVDTAGGTTAGESTEPNTYVIFDADQVGVTSVTINMSNGGGNANAWGLDELEVYQAIP